MFFRAMCGAIGRVVILLTLALAMCFGVYWMYNNLDWAPHFQNVISHVSAWLNG